MSKISVRINGVEYLVSDGQNILDICLSHGIEVPFFCYHKALSVAGNCRMCLVENTKSQRISPACCLQAHDGLDINTQSESVIEKRKGILELLLINHPLDCPECDKGGECDLQDLSLRYGMGTGRFFGEKRHTKKVDFGPLIEGFMDRCIHCMRCVRFVEEVSDTHYISSLGRGSNLAVTPVLDKFYSELSHTIIDLCPVGALTARPYAYTYRPWDLKTTASIDVFDSQLLPIYIDVDNHKIKRIRPRDSLISNRARFSFDGLCLQRLDTPFIRKKGQLVAVGWDEALSKVATVLRAGPQSIVALAGAYADMRTLLAIKKLLQSCNSTFYDADIAHVFPTDNGRGAYLWNTHNIEDADICLLIGANIHFDAPYLASRLKKLSCFSIGPRYYTTYPVTHIGDSLSALNTVKETFFMHKKKPLIIIGEDMLKHKDGTSIYWMARYLAKGDGDWNGFNVLHKKASAVGALDIGFVSKEAHEQLNKNEDLCLFLLGYDQKNYKTENNTVIYIGHHGDLGASQADIILPSTAYTEKTAHYTDLFGYIQCTQQAVSPKGLAKDDWEIIESIGSHMGIDIASDTHLEQHMNTVTKPTLGDLSPVNVIPDIYMQPSCDYFDNIITKNSKTMATYRQFLAEKGIC